MMVYLAKSAEIEKRMSVICASVPALATLNPTCSASLPSDDSSLLNDVQARAPGASRSPFLDLVRAAGAQLIVLHHLAFYGPLSERAYSAAPAVFDWLVNYARMAVQVFLVMGGFFAARSISRGGAVDATWVFRTIGSRYRRVAFPYWVTLVLAIFANEVARQWMTHEAISNRPTFGQLVAHAALLHDLLDYEALSAGIWYLAIDFQLYVLTLLVFWFCHRCCRRLAETWRISVWQVTLLILSPLAVLSLLWFNRQSRLDCWAVYFLGSYYLGILLHESLANPSSVRWVRAYAGLAVVVGLLDSRPRIVVAAGTVLLVLLAKRTRLLHTWPKSRTISYLGRSSYSLFLIHFPVLLVVNAWGNKYLTSSAGVAVGGMLIAYVASLAASSVLYHAVEKRIR